MERKHTGCLLVVLLGGAICAQQPARESAVRQQLDREVMGNPMAPEPEAGPMTPASDPVDALVHALEQGTAHNSRTVDHAMVELKELGVLALPALYRNLEGLNAFGLRNVLDLLVSYPEPRLYDALARLLQSDERSRRVAAARVLAELPREPAQPLIELAAKDPDPLVRLGAIAAQMGGWSAQQIAAALQPFVGSDHAGVRDEVWRLLDGLQDWSRIQGLVADIARSGDDDWGQRAAGMLAKRLPRDGDDDARRIFDSLDGHGQRQRELLEELRWRGDRMPFLPLIAEHLDLLTDADFVNNVLYQLEGTDVMPSVEVVSSMLRSPLSDRVSAELVDLVLRQDDPRWIPVVENLLLGPVPYGHGDTPFSTNSTAVAESWLAEHAPRRLLDLVHQRGIHVDVPTLAAVVAQAGDADDVPLAADLLRNEATWFNSRNTSVPGGGTLDQQWDGLRRLIERDSGPQHLDDLLDLARVPAPNVNLSTFLVLSTAIERWFTAEQIGSSLPRLLDVEGNTRRAVLEAIQRTAAPKQVPALAGALDQVLEVAGDDAWGVVKGLMAALAHAGGDAARAVLAAKLDAELPAVRAAALQALLGMPGSDVEALLHRTLGPNQPPVVVDVAVSHPQAATDSDLRAAAISRLRHGDVAGIDLGPWFTAMSDDVRRQTASGLLEPAEGEPPPAATVMAQAIEALGGLPDPDIATLARWLHADSTDVRRAVVWSLGRTYQRAAVPYLIEALKDDDQQVRTDAENVLKRFETFFEQKQRWENLGAPQPGPVGPSKK